ncbi:MAG: hypothetical protein JWQ97_3515 [Phenylobacterium sp.]|nr:hypothetical protein [Phenylobacterium sp.]
MKTCLLTAAALALGVGPGLAQSAQPTESAVHPPEARSAASSAAPTAAVITAPAVGVVVDPESQTAVVVPINPHADVPPEVTTVLKALYATGRIKPGQVAQIVVQRGAQVTEVIANAPPR